MQRAVLFIVAAGPSIGGGHVVRCLALAAALSARFRCVFLAGPEVAPLLDAFAGPEIGRIGAEATDKAGLLLAGQEAARSCDAAAVVFDHYGLCASDHRSVAAGRPVVVVDDLADRPLGADLVVDPSPGRGPDDYLGRLEPGARIVTGPRHALVRPEFRAVRDRALARRRSGEFQGRALISMGLTDVGGVTAKAARVALAAAPEIGFDVVLGETSPSHDALVGAADTRLRLHPRPPDMVALMETADFAIGAGGGTTWERCTLGLPSLIVILAENQKPSARAIGQAGAALVVDADSADFADALRDGVARLAGDPAVRRQLAEASAAICDGLGAVRVAQAVADLLS